MSDAERGLTALSLPQLRSLTEAIERGELACPVGRAALIQHGTGPGTDDVLAALGELPRDAALAALRIALAERVLRPPPHLDLVWTGPDPRLGHARDTAVLVRELFEGAQASVLIAGYSFDHGQDIFAALHAGMRDRGVTVEVFADVPGRAATAQGLAAHVRAYVDTFLGRNWPFGPPWPTIYYDPRTVAPGGAASLHAKCIVVDGRRTLVTSANFTDRGQTRNVELGVLIDDPGFGARVVGQFRALVDSGLLVPVS